MNLFDRANQTIKDIEHSFVNLVSALAPWLAPIAPASMAYQHMIEVLRFHWVIALSIAIVIEILGLASVSTIMSLWDHNKANSAKKNQIPWILPASAFGFYLTLVLSINVLLELPIQTEYIQYVEVGARALLTLLSVPAALIIAVRKMQNDVLDRIAQEKRKRDNAKEKVKRDAAKAKRELENQQRLDTELEQIIAKHAALSCQHCDYIAKSTNGLNAHMRKHATVSQSDNGNQQKETARIEL